MSPDSEARYLDILFDIKDVAQRLDRSEKHRSRITNNRENQEGQAAVLLDYDREEVLR